jgi:hypothetical protein
MNERQRFVDGEFTGRRYQYDGRSVLAVDFGPGVEGSVDLVGDTAIVVVDDDQYEFEVPEGIAARASVNNGILTVEVEQADPDAADGDEPSTEVED